jgi:hypothetical protein
MDADLRARFNAAWTPEIHRRVRQDLERRVGCPIPFPIAETPVFLPHDVKERFERAAREIVAQLCEPRLMALAEAAVPARFHGPGRGPLPQFTQVDFAVTRDADGTIVPKLVELQGFPSLYGFQILLADTWCSYLSTMPGLPEHWRLFFSGFDRYRAMAFLREAILGGHEPEDVVLLDFKPIEQKTFADFAATQRWFGVDPVCPTELVRDGSRLFRRKSGRTIPVRRIFHRIIFEELDAAGETLPFRLDEPMGIEWAPHPAWFYAWSKSSLLDLDHPSVPETTLLSELKAVPKDLSRHVLKPLYSFAGHGVKVDVTRADLDAIPAAERSQWVLQEKVEYAPVVRTVDGHGVKVEMRMMFVRRDTDEQLTLLLNLLRLSRGKMMGVDFTTDLSWTGSSVAIWPV